MASIDVMSTRLFPKNQGADAYVVNGIAARCDWVVLSDTQPPHVQLVRRNGVASPRHVFLSLRSPFDALAYFCSQVLPLISEPFVLLSGSEDVTVPHQLDLRWRRFNDQEATLIDAVLRDPRLIHWFAENLDDDRSPKMSPLPLGMVFSDPGQSHRIEVPLVAPLRSRPLRVLCAHRVRPDTQWDVRRQVTRLCRERFGDFCTVLEDEVTQDEYFTLIQQHAFVICAQGGGLDPAPKAWHSLLYGAIPIVRSTPLDAAYAALPVARVGRWSESSLTVDRLRAWVDQYAADFDTDAGRAALAQRLSLDYWWSRIGMHARRGTCHD